MLTWEVIVWTTSNRFDEPMTTTTPTRTTTHPTTGLSAPATQLKLASIGTLGFALMIAFGSHELTDGPLRWFADLLFWPLGDPQVLTNEAQLLAAILGGIMASWAALVWMLTDALAAEQPLLLRRLILTMMTIWFVIDSAGSVASGGWLNVIGNLAFLALFVLPARRLR